MLGWEDPRPLSQVIASPKRAAALADKPGLKTVTDAVLNFPATYIRTGSTRSLAILAEGEMYTCVAKILHAEEWTNPSPRGPRKLLRFSFTDGALHMTSAIFGNVKAHKQVLTPGSIVMLYGKVALYRDQWQLKNPSYVTVEMGPDGEFGAFGPLRTIVDIAGSYSGAQKLLSRPFLPGYPRRAGTSTAELIGVMDRVLRAMREPKEVLPRPTEGRDAPAWPVGPTGEPLIDFALALREIHQPPDEGPEAAMARLKFNEALELQLVMALRRVDAAKRTAVPIPVGGGTHTRTLREGLPYALTPGQRDALERIETALDSTDPASLMLQGEVGSGKTIVALLAMTSAVDAGFQCAFIAPTEVLAVQHARTLTSLLEGTGVKVTLLTGSQRAGERKAALLDLVSGESDIVVGTHALIQEHVVFYRLGLVVVDEQHRFGVHQRDKLRQDAPEDRTPHMLVMTATPIPRTVAMTMFGDLTHIRLTGVPQGRGQIGTAVVHGDRPRWVERMWQRVVEEVRAGHQAYVVVPRIEGHHGVLAWAERLAEGPLAGCRIGVMHGRLPTEEKEEVMRAFVAGEISVLVATTVIEVGVDVPNASMMVIIDADSLGVSQLHQLRGRVGRGSADSWCLLYTNAEPESKGLQRLAAVAGTQDGFELAELDLRQRTEGDVLGQDQSGARYRRARLLDLAEDEDIVREARRYAEELVEYDESLARALVVNIELAEQDYIERS
ncbi:ATP-dependent DNA helicase RecG [Corynebacterium heidelbergense]|uniref:ATP-dependent DNA helicase RecG n=1 Tax=Corynebacterium heidelbergense TaxID=2055947 RepID=A0A364V704_9CORY|nr:ATP-dependent DNA helicase RecG [Corynebacterium heidelbergense]RAV32336.1 ATP-dependent DNA helicase RecG [Corynebacterium heidelbergense]